MVHSERDANPLQEGQFWLRPEWCHQINTLAWTQY